MVVLQHSQFWCDITSVVVQIVGDYDLAPLETYLHSKIETFIIFVKNTYLRGEVIYRFVTCKRAREYRAAIRQENKIKKDDDIQIDLKIEEDLY